MESHSCIFNPPSCIHADPHLAAVKYVVRFNISNLKISLLLKLVVIFKIPNVLDADVLKI